MQTIKRFFAWYSNTYRKQKLVGKAAFGCFSIVVLCCLCSIPVAIMTPSTPTPEVEVNASIATQTEKPTDIPINTLSPIPTLTLTPQQTPDAYETSISEKIPAYAEAFLNVNEMIQQIGKDTSLLFDSEWKTKLGLALGVLNFRAEDMVELEPSPKYVNLHPILVKLSDETHLFTEAYSKGIDNVDSDMINKASQNLSNITALMQEATSEMERIKAEAVLTSLTATATSTPDVRPTSISLALTGTVKALYTEGVLTPVATVTTFLSILPANNTTETLSPINTETPLPSLEPLATPTILSAGSDNPIVIISVNKSAEYVDIKNNGTTPQNLSGWRLVSEVGNQSCTLSGTIEPSDILRIFAQTSTAPGFNCGYSKNIWNNSKSDPAVLYNSQGKEVSRY